MRKPPPNPETKTFLRTIQRTGHTHRGQPIAVGETIELRAEQAAWLDHEKVTAPADSVTDENQRKTETEES